jgi:fucose 4-O-acetylase-like acetyltransferase
MSGQKISWINLAKAIGIIAVVIGHSGWKYSYLLYWFHMPLFFFISGYLYNEKTFKVIGKTKSYLIPYVSYFFVISFLFERKEFDLMRLFKGGVWLNGWLGVFWFVTCLYLTVIIHHFLHKKLGFVFTWIIAVLSYLVAHWLSVHHLAERTWWAASVVLIAIFYYQLGFVAKRFNLFVKHYNITFALSSLALIGAALSPNVLCYRLDLKHASYTHYWLDLLIPLSIILFIISMLIYFENHFKWLKGLQGLGEASMTIMYLHIPFYLILKSHCTYTVVNIVLSLVMSYAVHYCFQNPKWISLLFLGKTFTNEKEL